MRNSASKGLQDLANSILVPCHTATGAERDRLYFPAGALEVVVDDRKVITAVVQHLLSRAFETPANFVFRILAASANAPLQVRARRRQNENGDCSRQLLLHLKSALNVDFKNEI